MTTRTPTRIPKPALPALLIAAILWAVTAAGGVAEDAPPAVVKPYPLDNCVVSNDKIDPQVPPLIYNGQEYRFCCRGCIKKFNRDPEKYAARLLSTTNKK
jgi:YHS domain-containing protein